MFRIVKYAAIVVFILAAATTHASAFKRTHVGEKAADFTLETLDGESYSLSTTMGKKATVVIFWAAWSPRSAQILPDMQKFYAENGPEDFKAIGVNVEHQEWDPADIPKIREIGEKAGVTFPMLVDKDLAIFNEYGVAAVPSAVLLDGEGTVKKLIMSYGTMAKLEFQEDIKKMLGLMPMDAAKKKPAIEGYKPKGKAYRFYSIAKRMMDKRMYKKAVKSLDQSIGEDPDYAAAYRMKAEALDKMGEADESAAALAKAEELETAQGITPVTTAPALAEGEKKMSKAARMLKARMNGEAAPPSEPPAKVEDKAEEVKEDVPAKEVLEEKPADISESAAEVEEEAAEKVEAAAEAVEEVKTVTAPKTEETTEEKPKKVKVVSFGGKKDSSTSTTKVKVIKFGEATKPADYFLILKLI